MPKIILIKTLSLFLLLFTIFFTVPQIIWANDLATERNIKDIIMERRTLPDVSILDINNDGKVDVADLAAKLRQNIIDEQMARSFIGTMTFGTSDLYDTSPQYVLPPQNVEIVLPAGEPGSTFEAQFKAEDSPFFSADFTMTGAFADENRPVFSSAGTGVWEADDPRNPINRAITWEMNITNTILNNGELECAFTMRFTGLTLSAQPFEVNGKLYLQAQYADDKLLFEDADNMERLVQLYGF